MAFPTTGILDNFNRADTGPPPSGNWSAPLVSGEAGLKVLSNALASGSSAASSAYWSASTFGPDVEVYLTLTATERPQLMARISNPNSGAENYYVVYRNSSTTLQVYRVDASVPTQLGADISQAVAVGDSFGMSVIGSTITIYYKASGGSWTSLGTRTDSTYSAAGYIGVLAVDGNNAAFGDDFGGGTIGSNPIINPPSTVPTGKSYPIDLRTFSQTTDIQLIGKDSFFGPAGKAPAYDWPNPRGPLFPIDLRTFLNPIEIQLASKDKFFGAAGQPPANLDWPVPRGPFPTHLRTWTYNTLENTLRNKDQFFNAAGQPPANTDFPVPKGAIYPSDLRTFVNGTDVQLIGQDKMFGAAGQVVTYEPPPNPNGKPFPQDLRTFTNSIEIQLIGQDQFFGAPGQTITYNWTVPPAARQPVELKSFWQNLLETTLGVILPFPFSLKDWPNPRGSQPRIDHQPPQSLLQTTLGIIFGPFNLLDWPNPRGPIYSIALRIFGDSLKVNLQGKDQMYGAPGQVPTGAFPNPVRRPDPGWLRQFIGQLATVLRPTVITIKLDVAMTDSRVTQATSRNVSATRLEISDILLTSIRTEDRSR